MTGKLLPIIVGLAVLIWVGFVASSALSTWPHIPLDMGGRDAGVAAAHQKAVTAHVLRSVLMAVVPAIAAGLVLLALRHRK